MHRKAESALEIRVDFRVDVAPPTGCTAAKCKDRAEDCEQDQGQHHRVFDCCRCVVVAEKLQNFGHLARLVSSWILEAACEAYVTVSDCQIWAHRSAGTRRSINQPLTPVTAF